jgi:hypothetical protein
LHKYRFEEIAARGYPDGVFASDYDIVSDTSKARRFGFHELVDTEEMFLRMFSEPSVLVERPAQPIHISMSGRVRRAMP